MNAIVADGRRRWLGALSSEYEQRAFEWFAEELRRAGWWRRQVILWRIRRRMRVIVQENGPSARTMW